MVCLQRGFVRAIPLGHRMREPVIRRSEKGRGSVVANVRCALLPAALSLLLGCAPASSHGDAGAVDAGSPADAGQALDAGLSEAGSADAGSADAGLSDAGSADAGPIFASLSCGGIVGCVESLGFSMASVAACEEQGTADAGVLFGPLAGCAESCDADADASGCFAAVTADGGACATQWVSCELQGVGCGTVLGCLGGAGASPSAIAACLGQGTATATGLAEIFVGCEEQACGDAGMDFQMCLGAANDPDGGQCFPSIIQCQRDTSAMP